MINFAKSNGNDENIYNINVFGNYRTGERFTEDEDRYKWCLKYLEILRNEYLEDLGVKNLFYEGTYQGLYEEIEKIIYLKTADKLRNPLENNQ